ncbi:MAG: NAD(+)/NADH kinase [Blastocatellia bacterium]
MARKCASVIGLITKPKEPRATSLASTIAKWAADRGIALLVDHNVGEAPSRSRRASYDQITTESEAIVVLGGDGTMIAAARLVGGSGTPVLGINLGSLGYLTDFAVEDTEKALDSLCEGDYEIDPRAMLDWRAVRQDEEFASGIVLNDVVINKSTVARIIEIDCWVDSRQLTKYRGDGLIVATPTGSTAYNLSAGGPIIHPDAQAVCIAPICPHTLTNRPIVLPDTIKVTLQLITREQEVMLTSDGQTGIPLLAEDRIEIKKSPNPFNMVRPRDRDYFQILRDKLRWSGH